MGILNKFFGIGGAGGASMPNQAHTKPAAKHKASNAPTHAYVQKDGHTGIKCLSCGRTSWNSNDVQYRFCACCNRFHDYSVF